MLNIRRWDSKRGRHAVAHGGGIDALVDVDGQTDSYPPRANLCMFALVTRVPTRAIRRPISEVRLDEAILSCGPPVGVCGVEVVDGFVVKSDDDVGLECSEGDDGCGKGVDGCLEGC